MIVGGIIIGSGRINNVVLTPGNNSLPIRATVDIKTAIQNLPALFVSQVDALKSGNIEISASGNSTVCNGQHIPYYEAVLNNLMLTTEMPLVQILIDTLESYLSSNSMLSNILNSFNGTAILGQLLGGTVKGNSSFLSALRS